MQKQFYDKILLWTCLDSVWISQIRDKIYGPTGARSCCPGFDVAIIGDWSGPTWPCLVSVFIKFLGFLNSLWIFHGLFWYYFLRGIVAVTAWELGLTSKLYSRETKYSSYLSKIVGFLRNIHFFGNGALLNVFWMLF